MQVRAYTGHHDTHRIAYTVSGPFTLAGVGTVTVEKVSPDRVSVIVGEVDHEFEVARYGDIRHVDSNLGPARLVEVPRFPSRDGVEVAGSMHAPMPGKVVRIDVSVGDEVSEGSVLVVMEAMKMEHTLRAPHDGIVTRVSCSAGDQVDADAVLVVVDES
jgi:acetyl/propionyl-CoA carboxylase alpha subunit